MTSVFDFVTTHRSRSALSQPVLFALAISCVTALGIFAYPSSGYFLYDDAGLIWDAQPRDLNDVIRTFTEIRHNFYRPLSEIAISIQFAIFSARPLGYHLVNVLIHTATACVIYKLGRALIGWEGAIVSASYFLISPVHAEPVMWISGQHSLLAGLLASLAFAFYVQSNVRACRPTPWIGASLLTYTLALMAKESAFTFPLLVVAYHATISPQPKQLVLLRLTPFLYVMTVYATLRLPGGTIYPTQMLHLSPLALMRNAAGYMLAGFTPLPDEFRYPSSTALWHSEPALPAIALALALLSLALLATRGLPWITRDNRPFWFSIAWVTATLLPVLPIYAERQLYLPSVGAALAVGAVFSRCYRHLTTSRSAKTLDIALILVIMANLISLSERAYWWKLVGDISGQVTRYAIQEISTARSGSRFLLFNVPDRLRLAHIQGPHFPRTIELASNGAIGAGSVIIGSYLWPAPENVGYRPPASLADDPSLILIDLKPAIERISDIPLKE